MHDDGDPAHIPIPTRLKYYDRQRHQLTGGSPSNHAVVFQLDRLLCKTKSRGPAETRLESILAVLSRTHHPRSQRGNDGSEGGVPLMQRQH